MDFTTQINSLKELLSWLPSDIITAVGVILVFLLALAIARIVL